MKTVSASASTVLTQGQRFVLAHDQSFGGGNVLKAAIAANPNPEVPFIYPVRPVLGTDGQPLTAISLLTLDHLAESWSVWYRERGVGPRDRVAIYLEDSFAYSVHFHALAQIGAVPVMVNTRASSALAAALCRQTGAAGMYTDRMRLERLERDELETVADLGWVEVVENVPAPPSAALPETARFMHADEDPVSILHSSGTTGRPKAVVQTHRSSVAGPRFRMLSHVEAPGALMMTALPQSHLGCIAYSIYAVLCGTPLVPLYDPSGEELLSAVNARRPTSVMAFSHAYAELAALELEPGVLDSVGTWVSMGDAIHEPHIKRILAQRAPERAPAQFFDRLGTTELGWGVLLHVSTLTSDGKHRCVGTPTGVAEVTVLRPDGSEAAVGEFGLLGAKGPAITAGYWNDSDLTCRSRLAGYWLTGDVAYRDADGFFFQVDRAVDAIQTRTGTGYSVQMEEVVLGALADIDDCAVVAGNERGEAVAVAVVRCASAEREPADLLARANLALREARLPELRLLEVAENDDDFPVGVTGKVLKRHLRARYEDVSRHIHSAGGRQLAATSLNVE
jgi:acyl-coenzyme A synthetase/AMP-(fatty) acid ligase